METKYGKYIVQDIYMKEERDPDLPKMPKFTTGPSIMVHEGGLGADCSIAYHCVTSPIDMPTPPHSHDCHQFLCFFGGDPKNTKDFGAEIEICLGEEYEKHYIDQSTIVSIPPNLLHCPLNFKKVDKPIIFMEITLEREYTKVVSKDTIDKLPPEMVKDLSPEGLKKRGMKIKE